MRYFITRKDENSTIGRDSQIKTTTEFKDFDSESDLQDFCYEISDKGWFTVTWVEIEDAIYSFDPKELFAIRTLNKLQARRPLIIYPEEDMDGCVFDSSEIDQAYDDHTINVVAARCNIHPGRLSYAQAEYFDIENYKHWEAVK